MNTILNRVLDESLHELLGKKTTEGLQEIASLFPQLFSSYYLEIRDLASHELSRLDLLCAIDHQSPKKRTNFIDNRWLPLIENLRSTYAKLKSLDEFTPFLWLEFDNILVNKPETVAAPGVHYCLESGYPEQLAEKNAQLSHYKPYVFSMGLCQQYHSKASLTLSRLFKHLPPSGHIIHISFMQQRKPATTKLYISMHQDEVIKYLEKVHFPGDVKEVEKMLLFWRDINDSPYLFFDLAVGDTLFDHFALVSSPVYFDELNNKFSFLENKAELSNKLCKKLASSGLITQQKSSLIQQWSSSKFELAWTWVDFKLVKEPNRAVYSKAYLGLQSCVN
ncbi:hypothetical protein L1D59_12210 [Pseudoalteromonas piscicida]|uniref:hypothetical protein n=1 Tax=Pseudoalteromonas piscicida TaxID=43662 RepID=UPI001EFC7F8A|nr:hypothetical protein [Pseudoalteromonas piscicida]